MSKVLSIIGTRPEAIKVAPVIKQLEANSHEFESKVLITGQHRELLDPMLDLFRIVPDYDLEVMTPNQTLTDVTCKVLQGMAPILEAERPDWIIVQGDTVTAMAASLAGFFQKIHVGHVEAGLRTFDKYSPFPEEVNRRVTGVVADLHFAPTPWAARNLLREGVPEDHILTTGNTVIDSLFDVGSGSTDVPTELLEIPAHRQIVLVTVHRQENFDDGIERIARGLARLATMHPGIQIVYPVHLNPHVREPVFRHLRELENVSLVEPLPYAALVWLLHRSRFVITDSGGLQEEAAGIGKPVLILRASTERPEGVDTGIAKLIGASEFAIAREAGALVADERHYQTMARAHCPYGDGNAARRIVEALAGRYEPEDTGVYELPSPADPLDALLHQESAEPRVPYAKRMLERARRRRAGLRDESSV